MEILLWLVPPLVVTLVAMAWASWAGRDAAEVDRERRRGAARASPERPAPVRYAPRRPPVSEGGDGVAVRPAREPALRPAARRRPPSPPPTPAPEAAVRHAGDDDEAGQTRQAS